jgi:hypothetical protein
LPPISWRHLLGRDVLGLAALTLDDSGQVLLELAIIHVLSVAVACGVPLSSAS